MTESWRSLDKYFESYCYLTIDQFYAQLTDSQCLVRAQQFLPTKFLTMEVVLPWVSGKVEVPIRLIIIVKNKNFQAYLYVFSVFPSFPFSRRFSIFSLRPFASSSSLSWPNMAYLVFNSTASFRPVSSLSDHYPY